MPTLQDSKIRYLIAAIAGVPAALAAFIGGYFILDIYRGDQPPPGPITLYGLVLLALLAWAGTALLVVYTRAQLTYTKKTFDVLVSAEPWLALAMPAFALATLPIDIVDAVIAWKRGARTPGDAAPPSRG